jgi:hypothetical protein
MSTTSPDSLPYPGDGDPPDGPGQLGALAVAVQVALTAIRATATTGANLASTVAALVAGRDAMRVANNDYDAGSYDIPANTNSYALAPTGNNAQVVFDAPPSGAVLIWIGAGLESDTGIVRVSRQVREGSSLTTGTIIDAASDADCLALGGSGTSANLTASSPPRPLYGLTPGDEYNVAMLYKNSNTTDQQVVARRILVLALP